MLPSNIVSVKNFFRSQSSRFFLISLLSFVSLTIILFMYPEHVYSVDIVLAWDANTEKDIDGYKIFRRGEGESYNYDNPVLKVQLHELGENPQEPTCTIPSLDNKLTHYFVVRAFDITGCESIDSNEVSFSSNVSPAASAQSIIMDADISADTTLSATDVDGDGILGYDELNKYNTDPADSEADGINDGAGLAFWRNNRDADYDSDDIINLLDKDSDDDGHLDGFEIKQGPDPWYTDNVLAPLNWTEYRLTLTIRSDDDAIEVMFCYQNNDNYYRFAWDSERNYRSLVKQENGDVVVLAEDTALYVPGETYELEIVVYDSMFEIWIDGSPIFSVEYVRFSPQTGLLFTPGAVVAATFTMSM